MNSLSRKSTDMRRASYREHHFPLGPKNELSSLTLDSHTSELLHHYITVVSVSLSGNRKPYIWHILMPTIGLEYPFVFHGIIAISALHMASLVPNRKQELHKSALAQESVALPSFRACFSSPNKDSIHPIFAFAGAIVYYIMASPDEVGRKGGRCRIPSRNDEYPHWFQAIRGLMALLANHWERLCRGPFGPLLLDNPVPDYSLRNTDDEQLEKLEGMFPSPTDSSTSLEAKQDAHKIEICREALTELRKVYQLIAIRTRLSNEAWFRVWIGNISQEFVELIFDRDPRALVILAHYCVLIKRHDHVWYLKGLGPGLLENIRQAIGDEWQSWIEWPIKSPVSHGA
jgi:hypothetical protein